MRNGQGRSWQAMLQRAGVAPDADLPTLRAKIERLGLVHDLVVANGRPVGDGVGTGSYAIVWAGGRWRDPEVPFGEARSDASPARALAEALGRFLVIDPGYPLR